MSQFTVSAWAASSQFSASYSADNAGDQRFSAAANERWAASGGAPHWLRADLGTAQVATWYRVDPGRAGTDPVAWTFEGSNDASSWTTLDTRSAQSFTATQTKTYTFTNATAYRYYRLNITSGSSVGELEIGDGTPHACVWEHLTASVSLGSGDFTTGLVFVVNSAIDVTHLLAYVGTTTGTWALRIRDSSGAVVTGTSVTYSFNSGTDTTGWREVALASPVTLSPGTYMVEQYGGGVRYSLRAGSHAAAVNYGTGSEVTVPQNSTVTFRGNSLTSRQSAGNTEPTSALGQEAIHGLRFVPAGPSDIALTDDAATSTSAAHTETVAIPLALTDTPATATADAFEETVAIGVSLVDDTATADAAAHLETVGIPLALTDDPATSTAAAALESVNIGSGPALGEFTAPVLTDARLVSGESQGTIPDVEVWGAKVETAARMRLPLVLSAPPLGVLTEWPLQRQAHVMPALSAAQPRMRPGIDYDIDYAEVGRPHVLVDGVDVTYLRGVPVRFADYTASVPLGPASASLGLPQLKPWDELGTGDLAPFDMGRDPSVEIAIVRPDDSVEQVWEGYLASDEDNSGENREDYTFHAEGLFAQAMNEPYDPPVWMAPTDPGWIVADVLNSVTHRRWNKIPRVNTGLTKVTDRGRPGQSKWQRVQDVLSKMLTVDGRQWTLARVAPYTYRIQLKATTAAADWTVTKGAPGVECSFVVDQGTRRDAVFGRGFAPDGGYWEGRVFPGLEFGIPPRYPMNNTSLNLDGRSDAGTDTGNGITLWQRKMRDLGYPVRVDGVMNSADVKWVLKIQRDKGLTVDGSLGPQTWAATWENNSTEVDLTTYRLPLVTKPEVEPFRYSASGARVGKNPADDPEIIRHAMPEIDFGSGIKKSDAIALARIILDREAEPGVQGRIVLTTDPHEAGASRFDIKPGDNVHVVGHRGGTTFQVSEVSVSDLSVTLTVDSKARDSLAVEAILERNEEARRDVSSRTGRSTDVSSLNKSSVVQYESESKAGVVPRTAVNGNSGLWTVRKIFVSQIGVAKVKFATGPKAELVVALFNRPVRISTLAAFAPDPLSSVDGWYDNVEALQEKYGLMEVFGSPGSPGGYWPRQKGDGPLTGRLRDSASSLYDSPFGGFVWVAMFTSRSTWVEGRVFPAVPT